MRLVVILFAESRDLLPRDNPLYHESYGLHGLFERLERAAARGGSLAGSFGAWPRILALFALVREGSHHPDPACGSGTFPLAALRFLTDALYAALQHHGRLEPDGDRVLVRLLGIGDANDESDQDEAAERGSSRGAGRGEPRLADELIPCRPDDDHFEPRLRAVLRRHVVERCIYAVDLDPLAVELCRLSLWIETMDRTLPFGFLDHKIKCGNALIGAWFDQFRHYPAMAWKNREGGDRNHANGVHFEKDARTQAIKTFVRERLTPDLQRFLGGATLFQADLLEQAATAHDNALAVLERMHAMPVHDAAERGRLYRDELVGSAAWRALKEAMDLWCACWFWPADQIEHAPLPSTFAEPPAETRTVARWVAAEMRFFHWELEFPDVFGEAGSGFDALLGNPPWETLQPSSVEYFSNIDPLYRSYGKQEALRRQQAYFEDASTEPAWLDYNCRFANAANWMKHASNPFGDPREAKTSQRRFTIARGRKNGELHDRWRAARSRLRGFCDPVHPFVHRGEGKAYTGRIPDFPVTRSHPPASWPSAANSSICRTYRKTAGEESRRRSPVANRWMRP